MSSDESNKQAAPLAAPAKAANRTWVIVTVGGIALLVVIAMGAGMWFLKEKAVDEMQSSLAAEKTRLASEAKQQGVRAIAAAQKAAQDGLKESRKEWLMLLSKPLLWSVRQSVLASNAGEIDAYIVELVKNSALDRIIMTSRDGVVVLASDRKMLDAPIDVVYPLAVKDAQAVTVLDGEGGKMILVIPVMGSSEKLGIFALTYDPAAPPKASPDAATAPTPATPGLIPLQ
jgi:hypothetical protein